MVGFGRTGRWFACNHYDVVPDILCVAKGINSGYVPLGAMIVNSTIRLFLEDNRFPIGMTYAGHPLACAVGVESVKILMEEDVIDRVAIAGELVSARLEEMEMNHRCIGNVRGMG
jgi:taurine--2-oxoglutarate transaminase